MTERDDDRTEKGFSVQRVDDQVTESKVERAKRSSRYLRGTLAETLASGATHFEEDDVQLLKFHGAYQQDDRDQRKGLRARGLDKAYRFLIRCAIPGGVLTAEQYLALDAIAGRYGNGTLRVTTRQDFQLHGVKMENLKPAIVGVNATGLTTFAACGDGRRNVMACPAPLGDRAHLLLRELTRAITDKLLPATRAYREVWFDEEHAVVSGPEEPFYGLCYLPRKFKVGLALESDNCVDIHSHDCGLVAVLEDGEVGGLNVLVGGGLGLTHQKAGTFARLAEPLGFVGVEQAVETVLTVAAILRDCGDRADRRHARLKYLIADWGIKKFRDEFHRRVSFELSPAKNQSQECGTGECGTGVSPVFHDHLGRHRQADGKWFLGVFVENGRISDGPDLRIRSAMRTIVTELMPGVVLTPQQNLLLTDLDESALDGIEQTLRDHGLKPAAELSNARRFSMACPALPTCGLALTESERLMPSVVDLFEAELARLGLADVPITLRMTGCPNGCARTYTADIAFVGRRPDIYHVFVGGGLPGDRVADLYAADVSTDELLPTLRPLLAAWARQRRDAEGLGDFYQRQVDHAEPRRQISGKEEPTSETLRFEEPAC